MAYSAPGTLPEAFSLVVATHISLCDECRARLGSFDAEVGGAILSECAHGPVLAEDSFAATLARLIAAMPAAQPRPRPAVRAAPSFPAPLRDYVGGDLAAVKWRNVGGGVRQALLPTSSEATARLLYIPPGVAIPDHGHRGTELTLVLKGAFRDEVDALRPRRRRDGERRSGAHPRGRGGRGLHLPRRDRRAVALQAVPAAGAAALPADLTTAPRDRGDGGSPAPRQAVRVQRTNLPRVGPFAARFARGERGARAVDARPVRGDMFDGKYRIAAGKIAPGLAPGFEGRRPAPRRRHFLTESCPGALFCHTLAIRLPYACHTLASTPPAGGAGAGASGVSLRPRPDRAP
jgi:putative transcriptional regulator